MNIQHTDLATEYLREVDQRLAGLPVLQRRELLDDLRTHIETARVERNLGEGELFEVLERLGSPEVIAAAAHEEAAAQGWAGQAGDAPAYGWAGQAGDAGHGWAAPAGDAPVYGWPSPPSDAGAPREQPGARRYWLFAVAVVGLLFAGFLLFSALFVVRGDAGVVGSEEGPVEIAPPPAERPEPTIGR